MHIAAAFERPAQGALYLVAISELIVDLTFATRRQFTTALPGPLHACI
jgi:hypothetical protein